MPLEISSFIFLSGQPVSAAREIIIEKGLIKVVDNGHYRPSLEIVEKNVLKELSNRYYFSTVLNTKDRIKFTNGF